MRRLLPLVPILCLAPAALAVQAAIGDPPAGETRAVEEDPDPNVPRPGDVGIGDSYFPELGNGGYDVQHYDLRLVVDMDVRAIDAVAKIKARSLHALSAFNLDLYGLEVAGVEVNGAEAAFSRERRELTITPAEPIPSGVEFEVEVFYGGVPEPAPDRSHPGRPVGWRSYDSGIYVTSECVGAASWFPCNDHQRDKASFTFTVTAPKPYVVAANGILVEETDHGKARTYFFRASDEMAPYLATINIAEFDVIVEEGPNGIPLRTYHPVDSTPAELAPFEKQAEMVEFFELCFGPYPFECVGAVISYENIGGALETQTMPVYGRGMPESVVAHELAHQWFGDWVSAHDWADMWLNEGFATYSALLWDEFRKGPEFLDQRIAGLYRMLRQREVGSPADPGVEQVFSARTYMRGAYVLHRLREEVGDDIFFDILHAWVRNQANGTGSTAQFTELCSKKAKKDLTEFFAGVLYADVIPVEERFEQEPE